MKRLTIVLVLILGAVHLAGCGSSSGGRSAGSHYAYVHQNWDAYGWYDRHRPVWVIGRPDYGIAGPIATPLPID